MKITDHWLSGKNIAGQNVKKVETPNFYKPPFNTVSGLPDATIIHYTAMTSFDAAVKVLTTKYPGGGNASAHLVIGKNGEVTQLAPFNHRTWHAGESYYNGRMGYNSLSVGIEIDNVGWLKKFGDVYSRKRLKSEGFTLPEDKVYQGRHENPKVPYEYWEEYTDDQVDVVFEICGLLREQYGMIEFLGHDEIAKDRKQDPGPAFPMDELRSEMLKDRSGEIQEGIVNTNLLNIRSGAGTQYEKVAQPLNQNAQVSILEEREGWYKVKTEVEGWVSKKYITATK